MVHVMTRRQTTLAMFHRHKARGPKSAPTIMREEKRGRQALLKTKVDPYDVNDIDNSLKW